jgi:hypothetical protein
MKNLSQGRRIISKLMRSTTGYTYMEMLSLGISVAPWLRVAESLRDDERLIKGKRGKLCTWRIIKVKA